MAAARAARPGGGPLPRPGHRGERHCEELGRLARRGLPVAIVFVAQRGDVEAVEPEEDVDPAFGAALRVAAARGARVLACALELSPAGAVRATRVPVRLHGGAVRR